MPATTNIILLAKHKGAFVGAPIPPPATVRRSKPSLRPESQGAFADACAATRPPAWTCSAALNSGTQTDLAKPPVRINTDLFASTALGRSESTAWD